ncbi:ParA family protein [Rhodobium gokarnense]|uniref:Chromosome partitioning protein n=1 Tax=Rhodobium gokarnense TaxID=364296 RepID=A0ABT3H8U3_9HYPH|nr:ParA family protein [Rhodobium gokarnense]MCW2306817.1 chromosome partitioning protein [Rhodobium gokarnense]
MARRILFTSQKGGVGKSTLARAAAVALAARGRKVLLADFDEAQQTVMRWNAQRRARGLEPELDAAVFSKKKKLRGVDDSYDDIVIDTRGHHDEATLELAGASDVVFLPASFSSDDLFPTLRVVASLRETGVAPERVAIVFCRTGGSKRQEEQARSVLEMNRIAALSEALPQKDGFVTAYATGRTGAEAPNRYLRAAAKAVDDAMLDFIDKVAVEKKRGKKKAAKA